MAILNCLWVGVLAGLVGSRLMRTRDRLASPGSSVAVGVMGALLGLLSQSRLGNVARELPHGDIVAAGAGAAMALLAWGMAQRCCLCRRTEES